MKKENLKKAHKAVNEVYQLEHFLQGLKENRFDLEINNLGCPQAQSALQSLTASEREVIKALKDAIFVVLRQATERTLSNLEAEIKEM
ncbi:MAG: hypothetical protein K2H16_07175 [Prevotella sp.]|nr:hypothetical protein [Prevotella sp.]MDE6152454.1 hypothetical protein [Prevotella sp.]